MKQIFKWVAVFFFLALSLHQMAAQGELLLLQTELKGKFSEMKYQ